MKRYSKLTTQSQDQSQEIQAQGQSSGAREYATAEEMLRHDALHVVVPPKIAQRLQESLNQTPTPALSWWRRLFQKFTS